MRRCVKLWAFENYFQILASFRYMASKRRTSVIPSVSTQDALQGCSWLGEPLRHRARLAIQMILSHFSLLERRMLEL